MHHSGDLPKVLSLADPSKKMSKSDPTEAGWISMVDNAQTIRRKISRAVTDSDGRIFFDPVNKPGLSNLLLIYATLKGVSISEAEIRFKDQSYAQLKGALTETVEKTVAPIRTRFLSLQANPEYLANVAQRGQTAASALATRKLASLRRAIGLGP